jgi:hypothetical protein
MERLPSRSFRLWMAAFVMLAGSAVAHSEPPQKQKNPSGLLAGYTVLSIEKLTVQPKAVEAGFVSGQEAQLQKNVVAKLREKKLFTEVLDASETPTNPTGTAPGTPSSPADTRSRISVSGEVVDFNPGSAVKRSLDGGAGWGHATLKLHFVFRDAATGKQILALDEKTTSSLINASGG